MILLRINWPPITMASALTPDRRQILDLPYLLIIIVIINNGKKKQKKVIIIIIIIIIIIRCRNMSIKGTKIFCSQIFSS